MKRVAGAPRSVNHDVAASVCTIECIPFGDSTKRIGGLAMRLQILAALEDHSACQATMQ